MKGSRRASRKWHIVKYGLNWICRKTWSGQGAVRVHVMQKRIQIEIGLWWGEGILLEGGQ